MKIKIIKTTDGKCVGKIIDNVELKDLPYIVQDKINAPLTKIKIKDTNTIILHNSNYTVIAQIIEH